GWVLGPEPFQQNLPWPDADDARRVPTKLPLALRGSNGRFRPYKITAGRGSRMSDAVDAVHLGEPAPRPRRCLTVRENRLLIRKGWLIAMRAALHAIVFSLASATSLAQVQPSSPSPNPFAGSQARAQYAPDRDYDLLHV